jgi:hypothetical protein
MVSSGILHRVALVRTDVWEELSSSLIRVTKIGELGTTLAVTSNRRTLRRNAISPISSKEVLSSSETRFLHEPHGVTSQKTPFIIWNMSVSLGSGFSVTHINSKSLVY